MAVEYTNRTGQTYYLLAGKTKTGKPRYFFSATPEGKGEPVDLVPEGFEVHENPRDARVFLRKKRPQLISEEEKALVEKHVNKLKRSHRYLVDCRDANITIYESNADVDLLKESFSEFFKANPLRAGLNLEKSLETFIQGASQYYTEMMQFRLVDKERRLFIAERFCFRGSIDDWIEIDGPDKLKTLVKRYIKKLGTDDFFELY
jgi:hypothetical protein